MKASDPQFLYLIVILPILFGLTLFLDGLITIIKKKDPSGWISLISSILFVGFILAAALILSSNYFK